MNYKRKRNKAGIDFTTMVKELGIPEEKYKEVEDGKRRLEGKYLDKFMETIRKGKEIKVNNMSKINEIDKWLRDGSFTNNMLEYGYKRQGDLAKAVGISQSTISTMVNNTRPVSNALKLKLWDFLHDPINKNINKDINKTEIKEKNTDNLTSYTSWVYNNLAKEIKKKLIKCSKLEKELGLSSGYINKLIHKKFAPSEEKAKLIYDYFNNNETPIKEETNNKIEEEVKEPIYSIDKDIIELMKKDVEIAKLKRQIMLYEKLIERL